MIYEDFLATKRRFVGAHGFEVSASAIHPRLFPFQSDIVRWALRKGRAAIFAATGLGKTAMQVEFGKHVSEHGDVLILAPLAVAQQTVAEAATLDARITLCREAIDVRPGINITNYERFERFDASRFAGIILDESSILKSHDGKTRTTLIDSFARTPYRLACTATPAPNDTMELANHAEFLGCMRRSEMLATYFVHDGGETQKWRLKGHARRAFWQWVASWAVVLRSPADLGYEDGAYALPPLEIIPHLVEPEFNATKSETLFALEASTLIERRQARKVSLSERVRYASELVSKEPKKQWLIWCDLNAEADALRSALEGAVEVRGSDSIEHKESSAINFAAGKIKRLISKPSIFGFGLNWQTCQRMIFVGLSDSWESYHQAIRRCWRFGQTKPVHVHLIASRAENAVLENLRRKEALAAEMAREIVAEVQLHHELMQGGKRAPILSSSIEVPSWLTTRF